MHVESIIIHKTTTNTQSVSGAKKKQKDKNKAELFHLRGRVRGGLFDDSAAGSTTQTKTILLSHLGRHVCTGQSTRANLRS